jgi:hypothetical protein
VRVEDELLVSCARTRIDLPRVEQIRSLLRMDISWPYLIAAAEAHKVQPLLYRALRASDPEAVPAGVMNTLHGLFCDDMLRGAHLVGELLTLLNLLEHHGIPAIPIKGPVLAVLAYGNVSLRKFSDLDILVDRRDVLRTWDLLATHGYEPKFSLKPSQATTLLDYRHAYPFVGADGAKVEIHWSITPRSFSFPLDLTPFWTRVGSISMRGVSVPSFSPEDTLLILCVHGSRHAWRRLEWICDVAELVNATPQMDWQAILARAGGVRGELLMGLYLAKNVLNASVPDEVVRKISGDWEVQRLGSLVRDQLFRRSAGQPLGVFERFLLTLQVRESMTDRLRYMARALDYLVTPNVNDYAVVSLPKAFSWLYYVIRTLRIAGLVR